MKKLEIIRHKQFGQDQYGVIDQKATLQALCDAVNELQKQRELDHAVVIEKLRSTLEEPSKRFRGGDAYWCTTGKNEYWVRLDKSYETREEAEAALELLLNL
jgi:hypothetical protein